MQLLKRQAFFQEFHDYVLITLGLLFYSIGLVCFILPYNLVTGGLAGAGTVIYYASGFPVENTVLLVNVVLLSVAVKVLGWRFCLKTIYGVFMLSFLIRMTTEVMVYVGQMHPGEFVLNATSHLPQIVNNNSFMSCILGASIEGIGIGMVFLNNGSSGGT